MQKLIAILQIKSRNFADFHMWLKWYTTFLKCDQIYVCDDKSKYDIQKLMFLDAPKSIYLRMGDLDISNENPSFNRQQKNINAVLKMAKPNKDDVVILPDDDEFWWFDKNKYSSFIECVNAYRKKLGNPSALYVPWTLMRSKEVMQSRDKNKNFAECFQFRTTLDNCEHKPVLFYNGPIDSSFHCGYSNGKTITAPTNLYYHSKCKYDEDLRCYHFRFTTVEEFNTKRMGEINYDHARPYFTDQFLHQLSNGIDQNDKYDVQDLTVYNTFKSII
jgi:hypothetical protein